MLDILFKKISCSGWKQALLASLILSLFHSCPLPFPAVVVQASQLGTSAPCNHLQHFHFGKQTQKHCSSITDRSQSPSIWIFFQYCLDAVYYIFPEFRSLPAERKTALLWLWHTRPGWISWRGWELQSWLFPRSPGVHPGAQGDAGQEGALLSRTGWQPAHTRHGKKETLMRLKVVGSISSAWEGTENCWIDSAKKGELLFLFLECLAQKAWFSQILI